MGPRADFSCAHCSKKSDRPFIIENLPVKCQRCPICNHKRGFVRLFNSVNVMSGHTRNTGKLLDDALTPMLDKHSATVAGARSFEKQSQAAIDRSYHEATPAQRAHGSNKFQSHVLPGGQVLSAIPHEARIASREVVYPALTNRTVKPHWER